MIQVNKFEEINRALFNPDHASDPSDNTDPQLYWKTLQMERVGWVDGASGNFPSRLWGRRRRVREMHPPLDHTEETAAPSLVAAGRDPQNSSFTSFQIPPEGSDLVHVLWECLIHIKRVSVLTRCVGLGTLLNRSFFGNMRAVFHCLLGLKRFKASPSHKLSWSWQITFKVFYDITTIRQILQSHIPRFLWQQC